MSTFFYILLIGLIGAGIGWVTNVIAIRLLFRPYHPIFIPFSKWNFQGLIPKRQKDIAVALGNIVSTELLTGKDIALSLAKPEIKEKITLKVRVYVKERVVDKMPFIIPQTLKIALGEYFGKFLESEVIKFLKNPHKILQQQEMQGIKNEIQNIVEDKILSLEMAQLEKMINLLAKRELKHIEILGGILGFFIGILQGILTLYIRP